MNPVVSHVASTRTIHPDANASNVTSHPFCLPLPLPLPLPHRPLAWPGLPPLAPGQSEPLPAVEGSLGGGLVGSRGGL